MKKLLFLGSLLLILSMTGCSSIPEPNEPPQITEPTPNKPTEPNTPNTPNEPTLPEIEQDTPDFPIDEIEQIEPDEPIPPDEVEEEEEIDEPKEQTYTYLKCKATDLAVRTGANTSSTVLGRIQKGEYLPYYSKQGKWYETRYLGKKAYVHADYFTTVTLTLPESEYEGAISKAYELLGTKYVYGAIRYHDGKGNLLSNFSIKAFDCSSLVQYAYYIGEGIVLDVTTRTQAVQGIKVDKAERGYLLYMTNDSRRNKTGIERIGHVAIYLGGDLILHTASDYAKIEELSAKRKSDTLIIIQPT